MPQPSPQVTFENYVRFESARMFAGVIGIAGGSNVWSHNRTPNPIDQQTIIRLNRDTLYSASVIDVSQGATITVPDAGGRYMSVMFVNEGHYINRIIHEGGTYELTAEELGSDFVMAGVRILVDPENPEDVATVNALQDQFTLTSVAGRDFTVPAHDDASFTSTRNTILELAKGLDGLERCFGKKEDVDPIRHLLGTALGWGGLPETEATYTNVMPNLPVGEYTLTVGDVPVDGFWSISLYNADGFFEKNDADVYNINSITGVRNDDGTVTVRFGGDPTLPNTLPIMEGWNYMIRTYRPRPELLDGSWTFPTIEVA